MKISTVHVVRKHKLADYEMLEVGLDAAVTDQDNVFDAIKNLHSLAELYLKDVDNGHETQEEEKAQGVVPELNTLKWVDMPATEQNKGAWQKSTTKNTSYYAIKKAIEEKGGYSVFMEGYVVWLTRDGSLGRRKQ